MLPAFLAMSLSQTEPKLLHPVPTPRQRAWHELETYAFVHFGPNTFTGQEWGHGDEDPKLFNPKKLDCRQWAKAFKDGGMKGVILTAKHHDGFCLWPSKYSTHTVAQSAWKDGKGDVLKEFADACRKEGLLVGLYVSPWDRNHPSYGTDAYNEVFAKTLEEVLTGYGPLFEVWFDGANGEGPNGRKQVYDWPLFVRTVRKHQPNAVIFSDAGPDIRWVGNEQGYAGETNWGMLKRREFFPGTPRFKELTTGHEDGTDWLPAECDVSIRPGWFWRASEDKDVKSVEKLMDIYYGSVGRGSSLLLNVPPNADGLISDVDVQRLKEFRLAVEKEFAQPLSPSVDAIQAAQVKLSFRRPETFSKLMLREPIRYGQRVKKFRVEADGKTIAEGTTIGNKRLLKFAPVTAKTLTLVVEDSRAEPLISGFVAYK